MRTNRSLWQVLSFVLIAACVQAQNTPAPRTPEQQTAKLKEHWRKPLEDVRQSFQNSNDRESAAFVSSILDSFEQPNGMSPAALTGDLEKIKKQVRDLVRNGAIESAATLNWALWRVANQNGPGKSGPATPNHKTGGTPGPDGLVLYLPFDKDEGATTHDQSGAGNDGRVFGATWTSNGKFGGAYEFHITNLTDRIVIANSDTLSPDNITIAAWVKTSDRDGFWNRILDKDFRNAYCLDLGGDYNGPAHRGKLEFETSRGSIETVRALNDGQWHHVAATYDGTTIRAYFDGTGPDKAARNPGPLKKSGWDLCIGNTLVDYGNGEFDAFDGTIDEVRIYNRALSGEEIKSLAGAKQAVKELPRAESAVKPDAVDRLKKLKSLYDQGLITKEDYDKKVKEIMDSL